MAGPATEPLAFVERALARSRRNLHIAINDFPMERSAEKPGGEAKSFDEILRHVAHCDLWFTECADIAHEDAPGQREDIDAASGQALVRLADELREYVLGKIREWSPAHLMSPMAPGKAYGYPSLVDLWLYAAEHEFWHAGQLQALALLYAG
jgi:uncharacterized damage-inducible protein DinB